MGVLGARRPGGRAFQSVCWPCAAAQVRPSRGAATCRDSARKSRLVAPQGATLGLGILSRARAR
eukprot:9774945-Lingulodinium_polyedra.AAC.1